MPGSCQFTATSSISSDFAAPETARLRRFCRNSPGFLQRVLMHFAFVWAKFPVCNKEIAATSDGTSLRTANKSAALARAEGSSIFPFAKDLRRSGFPPRSVYRCVTKAAVCQTLPSVGRSASEPSATKVRCRSWPDIDAELRWKLLKSPGLRQIDQGNATVVVLSVVSYRAERVRACLRCASLRALLRHWRRCAQAAMAHLRAKRRQDRSSRPYSHLSGRAGD